MIQVINRALNILEFLANNSTKEHTLTEISDSLKFQHSTCANILKTLVNRGYVEQPRPKGSYRLGKMVYQLTDANKKYTELINLSRNLMIELRDNINETVILSVIKNNKRVLLIEIPGTHEIHVQTKKESSVYSATTGRMILAHSTPENINWIIDRVGLPTEEEWSGIDSKEVLIEELKKIKLQKIIITLNKNQVVGLATPILKNNEIIASLGVYLPVIRFGKDEKDNIEKEFMKIANKINQLLAKLS